MLLNIFLSQVTLKLGEETWTCPVPDLQLVPYLAVQAARWNTSRVINLPLTDGFQGDLSLLVDLLRITNKVDGWESIIPPAYVPAGSFGGLCGGG